MIDKRNLSAGMVTLARATGIKPTGPEWTAKLRLYHGVLGDLTDEQWAQAVTGALATWEHGFPPPAALRRLAGKGREALKAEAATLFNRLLETCGKYLPEVGLDYTAQRVAEVLGAEAAAAFAAAGGRAAFTGMLERDRPHIERRFIENLVASREIGTPLLPAVDEPERIGRGEARQLVSQVRKLASGGRQ